MFIFTIILLPISSKAQQNKTPIQSVYRILSYFNSSDTTITGQTTGLLCKSDRLYLISNKHALFQFGTIADSCSIFINSLDSNNIIVSGPQKITFFPIIRFTPYFHFSNKYKTDLVAIELNPNANLKFPSDIILFHLKLSDPVFISSTFTQEFLDNLIGDSCYLVGFPMSRTKQARITIAGGLISRIFTADTCLFLANAKFCDKFILTDFYTGPGASGSPLLIDIDGKRLPLGLQIGHITVENTTLSVFMPFYRIKDIIDEFD